MNKARWISISLVIVAAVVICTGPPCRAAEIARIFVDLNDTSAVAGDTAWLRVYMANYVDSIAAFQFQIRLDRPDLVQFDQSAGFDTVGTLASGFETVVVRDTSGNGTLLLVTGIADLPFIPRIRYPNPPQTGGVLINLPLITNPDPDTLAGLLCNFEVIAPITFVDPAANTIGVIVDTIVDTTYWKCDDWQADSCIKWIEVDGSIYSYDSISVDSSLFGYLDTTAVIINRGALLLEPGPALLPCDFTGDSTYAVTDLTCLVSFMFGSFDAGACPGLQCDCDASGNPPGEPNIADLTCLVAFLFSGGPPPLAP